MVSVAEKVDNQTKLEREKYSMIYEKSYYTTIKLKLTSESISWDDQEAYSSNSISNID
jgi:hypothetical protein